ncbi:MAG: M18 family aminopeptidase, partial [Erysipelotrichaceae bacterium]
MSNTVDALLKFINESPSCFHAIDNIKTILLKHQYIELLENATWDLKKGQRYFVTRNASSVLAFQVPNDLQHLNFQIVASHSDSPTFKIKPNAE